MQPIFLQRRPETNAAFKVCRNAEPYIHQSWHFHDELELVYIERGAGTQFIGDNIQSYREGDLFFLGPNVPHQWKSHSCNGKVSECADSSLALYFLEYFPGSEFYALPEMHKINKLIKEAARGVKVVDQYIKSSVYDKLCELLDLDGAEKVLGLFSILELIAGAKDNEILASTAFVESFNKSKDGRINGIYNFINDHFREDLTLQKMAAKVNMTPNSFCRYFKRATQKTPIEYLNEFRVNYVCQLLLREDKTIAQCAFESGFNNLANFNRRFKLVTGMTPRQYIARFNELD